MELCLVRHAIAVRRGAPGFERDELRPLTQEGRERMAWIAKGLSRLFVPQAILSSPLVRAVQTAEIIRNNTGALPLLMSEHLADGSHGALLEEISEREWDRLTLVGHEPSLSELLSLLISGSTTRVDSLFKKGGAAIVSAPSSHFRGGDCQLVAFLPPSALRLKR